MKRFSLLALPLAAALLAGCGSSSSSTPPANLPNIAGVETAIKGTIKADDHVTATVICPDQVPQIVGETFSCVAISTKPTVQTFIFQATEHGGTYVSYALTKRTRF